MLPTLFIVFLVLLTETKSELLHTQYDFDWKIEGDFIDFQVAAQTKGWVGLGINQKPLMKDACIAVAGVKDGRGYVYDTHGVGEMMPEADDRQNYELLASSENETHTALTIRRRLDTGDSFDTDISTDPLYILWAFGDADARNSTSFDYHSHRGYALFTFVNAPATRPSISPSLNDHPIPDEISP